MKFQKYHLKKIFLNQLVRIICNKNVLRSLHMPVIDKTKIFHDVHSIQIDQVQ